MTLEEKRAFVEAYCTARTGSDACKGCLVGRLSDVDHESCFTNATEEALNKRISVIEAIKGKRAEPVDKNLAAPVEKAAAQLSGEIVKAKAELCQEHCESYAGCDECPCTGLADHKHDSNCDFDAFSEEDLDEYLKNFAAEEETKREFAKVAPATETSLKDAVHPHHYKLPGGMQVIDVEVAMFGREAVMHHCLCTAAEYILRSRQKNGVEDIKKAHWWLCEYLELEAESHGK